jgi:small subunit ribosomal protein S14
MSKLSVNERNKKRQRMVAKYAERREALRKAGDWEGLQKLPLNSSPVRLRNRCIVTGKGKGVFRKYGLCRNQFRQLALEGKIPGVKKASW